MVTDQVRFYRLGTAQNRARAGGGGYESSAAGPGTRGVNEPSPLGSADGERSEVALIRVSFRSQRAYIERLLNICRPWFRHHSGLPCSYSVC